MSDLATKHQVGSWHFRVRPIGTAKDRFIAWCAENPNLGDNPLLIDWAQNEVHVEFADTAEEALQRLQAEVLL